MFMTKSKFNTKQLVLAALCVALVLFCRGVPQHPNAGSVLPMHIPVLLCGLVCGPVYGLLSGILTPLLQHDHRHAADGLSAQHAAVRAGRLRPCGGRAAPVRAHG